MREWDDWSRKRKKQNETDRHEKQSDGIGASKLKDTSLYTDADDVAMRLRVLCTWLRWWWWVFAALILQLNDGGKKDLFWSFTAEMRLAKPDGEPGDGSEAANELVSCKDGGKLD